MSVKYLNNDNEVYEGEYDICIARHSAAHVMAQAIKRLYKDAKLAIGPAIENGFYYDIDNVIIKNEDLEKIENEMKKILKENLKMETFVLPYEEAKEQMKDEPYKLEMIEELGKDAKISFFRQGEFVDMCVGPHVLYLSSIGKIKLYNVTGAYWRGDEKNKMLTRIYGTAFKTQEQLDNELIRREEAKKRDHKKLGKELELFFIDETAPGMPYWLPKGMKMLNTLIEFWRKIHEEAGYQEFSGPQLNSSSLWKTSGHWDHYRDDMFVLTDSDGQEQALKPMNCPNSIKVFSSKLRSYKDLPLRLSDIDVIHRNEKSGQLNGLFRVRMFRQDDSHNYVTEDQIASEIKSIVNIAKKMYGVFGLDFMLTLSTRPEDYMGDIEVWNKAESDLKNVLDEICGKDNYRINEGDGAFYGPKIDIKMKDCLDREWQMGTVQLDFQLPSRFGITYIDRDGQKKTPILIHRAIFGSFERFLGIITEHFAGAFPLWLSPVQVSVLPISENEVEYSKEIEEKLKAKGFRVELDPSSEKIGYKIRNAQLQKVNYMIVIGKNEKETNVISVRTRNGEKIDNIPLEEFIKNLIKEIKAEMNK